MCVLRRGYEYEKLMKSKVNVSIVIPVYNAAGFLETCLNSCLSQTYSSWEVIAVDDGSTDESVRILEEYSRRDSRIRPFVNEKINRGAAQARDYGVKQARGEYIFFLDSDDYIPSDAIERLYIRKRETDADMIVGDFEFVGHPVLQRFHYPAKNDSMTGMDFACLVLDTEISCIWGKLIRKSLFEDIYCYQRRLEVGEDLYTLLHLCLVEDIKVGFVPFPVYYYVQRRESLMNEPDERVQADRYYWLIGGLMDILEEYEPPVDIERRIMLYAAEKECYYLRVYGAGGRLDAENFSDSIRFFFHEREDIRKILWKKNKRIYFLLAIGGYSPDLAKRISGLSRWLFSRK